MLRVIVEQVVLDRAPVLGEGDALEDQDRRSAPDVLRARSTVIGIYAASFRFSQK